MQRLDDDIDPATRALLERYRFDRVEFERLREAVAHGRLNGASNTLRGAVEPPKPDDVTPLPAHHGDDWRSAYETGLASIRRGEVAMAVLNGGMATRFGGVVKGTVIALDSLSFLEWKLAEASRVATRAGGEIPCIVMNSFATDDHTQRFLAERASTVAGMPST